MTPDAGERRCREAVSGGRRERRRPPRCCERACVGGRYWVRTSDLFRVREARYRCANRPRRPRTRGRDGADDRIRTGDPHLGKVMLYQLSYVRTSAEPTKDDDIPARPASQMLGARSVRGHRGGEGAGHRAGAEWEAREAGRRERREWAGQGRRGTERSVRPVGDVRHIGSGANRPGERVSFFESTREGGQHLQGDWRRGSALPSHGRGHWFDPSIAHDRILGSRHADVAQLVEHHLAKVRVAGSNPVVRSV